VVVVQTVHRDALAVALQFAAHLETGPRKQGCSSVPASRASDRPAQPAQPATASQEGLDNTPPFREDAGVSGERRVKKASL
jgi:hypothetical protein